MMEPGVLRQVRQQDWEGDSALSLRHQQSARFWTPTGYPPPFRQQLINLGRQS